MIDPILELIKERNAAERERDEARVSCAEWRACARSLARVADYLKPDLRDENDGWSQERMAMRLYDKMEAAKLASARSRPTSHFERVHGVRDLDAK